MKRNLLFVSTVLTGVLGISGPAGASAPVISFDPGEVGGRICTDDPEDLVVIGNGGGQNLSGSLGFSSVTGSPQDFSFVYSLPDGETLGTGGTGDVSWQELRFLFLDFPCGSFDFDDLEEGNLPFTQPIIDDSCLDVTMTNVTGGWSPQFSVVEITEDTGDVEIDRWVLRLDFGVDPRPVGPDSLQINFDTSTCVRVGREAPGSSLDFDYRLPTVADEALPDTGSASIGPFSIIATVMMAAGAMMILRSRRFARS